MNLTPPEIAFDDVSLSYAGRDHIFESLHLRIPGGQFVAVVGRSGSGKTTLIKLIGHLVQPTAGSIAIGDETADVARSRGRLSYCFQDPVLFGWRTALDNVALPAEIMHRSDSDPVEALRLVGLESVAQQYPRELSGGMKQRVSLARALSYKAPIVLLDEPFASLDEINRMELNRHLVDVWSRIGFTCVMTTHSIAEAVALSDRVLLLSASVGGLAADIPIPLRRPRTPEVLDSAACVQLVRTVTEGLKL